VTERGVFIFTGVSDKTEHALEVVLGVDSLANVQERDIFKVKRVIVHPSFVRNPVPRNNIALLELDREWWGPLARLSLDPQTDPEIPPGAMARVAGFGQGSAEYAPAREVQAEVARLAQVPLPLVSRGECSASYHDRIFPTNICAGFVMGGRDSCQGTAAARLPYSRHVAAPIRSA
jgi:secreted trypsin-like serine protease